MKDVITMLLAVVFALAIGFGVYWYMNQDKLDISADISFSIQQEEIPAGFSEYDGNGFSFVYPDTYLAVGDGLVEQEGYDYYLSPRPNSSVDGLEDIEIDYVSGYADSVEDYLRAKHVIGADYDLATIANEYETVVIGKYTFQRLVMHEHFRTTDYVTKKGDLLVRFSVFFEDDDNEALQDIISTLKFK